jgi:hypothetical protein
MEVVRFIYCWVDSHILLQVGPCLTPACPFAELEKVLSQNSIGGGGEDSIAEAGPAIHTGFHNSTLIKAGCDCSVPMKQWERLSLFPPSGTGSVA